MHNKITIDFSKNNKSLNNNKFKSSIITNLRNAREIINNDNIFIELKYKLLELLKKTNNIKLVVSNNNYNIESDLYNMTRDQDSHITESTNTGEEKNLLMNTGNEETGLNSSDKEPIINKSYEETELNQNKEEPIINQSYEEIELNQNKKEPVINSSYEESGSNSSEEEHVINPNYEESGSNSSEKKTVINFTGENISINTNKKESRLPENIKKQSSNSDEKEEIITISGEEDNETNSIDSNSIKILDYLDKNTEKGSFNDNFNDDFEKQTYLMDPYDSDEESLISNAKQLSDKKFLNNLNVNDLRDIMRTNNMKLSKNGNYLKKNEMIKNIKNIFK